MRIYVTSVFVDDQAHALALGVTFTQEPTPMGEVITAVLDDTCGNLIQIIQRVA